MDNFKTLTEAYEQVLTNEGFFDRAKATGSKFLGSAGQLGKNIGSGLKAGAKVAMGDKEGAKQAMKGVKSVSSAGDARAGKSLVAGARKDLKAISAKAINVLNQTNDRFSEFVNDQQKMGVNVNPQTAKRMANVQAKINSAIQALNDASNIAY